MRRMRRKKAETPHFHFLDSVPNPRPIFNPFPHFLPGTKKVLAYR
jgi:hypothetical protein